jgi:hypothetical protein
MANPHPVDNLPPEKRRRSGRPVGSTSKTAAEAREVILWANEGVGGIKKMVDWATQTRKVKVIEEIDEKTGEVTKWNLIDEQPNLGVFYTQVLTRVLPTSISNTQLNVRGDLNVDDGRGALKSAFLALFAEDNVSRPRGAQIEARPNDRPNDSGRVNVADEELVILESTGTKAA